MATFRCDSCGYTREVPDRLAGRETRCPRCRTEGVVGPVAAESVAALAPEDEARFLCPSCGYTRKVPAPLVGRTAKCPKCGTTATISARPLDPADLQLAAIALDDLVETGAPPPPAPPRLNGEAPIQPLLPSGGALDEPSPLFQGSLPKNVLAGVVSGVLGVCFCLALAGLVFPQKALAAFFPQALGLALTSAAVLGAAYSLGSRVPFGLAGPESMACALLALLVRHVLLAMPEAAPAEQFTTAAAAVGTTAVGTGLAVYVLARLRLGALVRFIPTQVVGGVLAAVGAFLVVGALDFLTGSSLSLGGLASGMPVHQLVHHFLGGEELICLPGLGFGLILFFLLGRVRHSLFLLLLLALGFGLGLAPHWWPGSSLAHLVSLAGFLPAGDTGATPLVLEIAYGSVRWDLVLAQAPFIAAMTALVVMADMSRLSSLEGELGRELDLDREYRTLGKGNILAGLLGGMPGAVSLGRSLGNRAAGAGGGLAGVVAAVVCVVAMLHLGPWLPFIPRFVPGGFLVYLGLNLMKDWLVDTRTEFTRRDDYLLLLLTFVFTVALGLLLGMAVGLTLALFVTVSRYGRISAVGLSLSGASHRSSVGRGAGQLRILGEKGDQILLLKLRGFLFLGSVYSILRRVRSRLDVYGGEPLRYLILDFRGVVGMGSSVNVGLSMLLHLAEDKDFRLICTNLRLEVAQHLEHAGYLTPGSEGPMQVFVDQDYALEWCENRILEAEHALAGEPRTLKEILEPVFPEPELLPLLIRSMTRVEVPANQAVFHQGDVSDALYFIESGSVNVELELERGRGMRLKKMGPGTVFGEMGLYTTAPRSATVVASQASVLYRLTTERFKALQVKAPPLAAAVHRYVVQLLAEHLAQANSKLRDLSREG